MDGPLRTGRECENMPIGMNAYQRAPTAGVVLNNKVDKLTHLVDVSKPLCPPYPCPVGL